MIFRLLITSTHRLLIFLLLRLWTIAIVWLRCITIVPAIVLVEVIMPCLDHRCITILFQLIDLLLSFLTRYGLIMTHILDLSRIIALDIVDLGSQRRRRSSVTIIERRIRIIAPTPGTIEGITPAKGAITKT